MFNIACFTTGQIIINKKMKERTGGGDNGGTGDPNAGFCSVEDRLRSEIGVIEKEAKYG